MTIYVMSRHSETDAVVMLQSTICSFNCPSKHWWILKPNSRGNLYLLWILPVSSSPVLQVVVQVVHSFWQPLVTYCWVCSMLSVMLEWKVSYEQTFHLSSVPRLWNFSLQMYGINNWITGHKRSNRCQWTVLTKHAEEERPICINLCRNETQV